MAGCVYRRGFLSQTSLTLVISRRWFSEVLKVSFDDDDDDHDHLDKENFNAL